MSTDTFPQIHRMWWYRACVASLLLTLIRACSLVPGTELKQYTRAQILYMAPYVLLGNGTTSNFTTNTATMSVTCVLKAPPAVTVPSVVYVHNIVVPHSCQANPIFMLGTLYILALQKPTSAIFDYPPSRAFDLYSPEVLTPNVFYANEMTLDEAAGICGMSPVALVTYACPEPPDSECVVPTDGAIAQARPLYLLYVFCVTAWMLPLR